LADNEYALKLQIEEQRKEIAEHEKLVDSLPAAQGSAAYGALLTEKSRIEADIKSTPINTRTNIRDDPIAAISWRRSIARSTAWRRRPGPPRLCR